MRPLEHHGHMSAFAPSVVHSVQVDPGFGQRLLTVENLTTFHEMAGQRPDDAIVIYTGRHAESNVERTMQCFWRRLHRPRFFITGATSTWADFHAVCQVFSLSRLFVQVRVESTAYRAPSASH